MPPSQPGTRRGSNAEPVRFQGQTSAKPVRFPAARVGFLSLVLVVGECSVRLAARPAATCQALRAHRVAVGGQRAAHAGTALAAAGQAGLHDLITCFPSVQVSPPFRGAKVRSATVPGTIGTGNL